MAKDIPQKPDVKDVPADKKTEQKTSGQVGPAPKQPGPAKAVPFEQAKAAAKPAPEKPGNADKAPAKPVARQNKPTRKPPEKPGAVQGKAPAKKDAPAKPSTAQQKPAAGKKTPAEKEAPAESGPSLEQQKAEIEKELREKFGIPKSAKTVEPWVAPKTEKVVRIPHDQLHSFKNHPFTVEKNPKFLAFVASIRAHGVTQPAIVRPREGGGYEVVSGHRRDFGSIEAGIPYTPCIVRALNDDKAIQQMVEDNVNNREIGTMELARALNMQLESLKHQGAQETLDSKEMVSAEDVGKRSNAVVAERNGMSVKQVQRHIALIKLVPALQEMVDGKAVGDKKTLKISFTPAVELSAIKPQNQEYIAVAIEGQQAAPSLSQAKRMKELDQQGILNHDVIDGILLEEKKEVDKVIISTQELGQYFGKEKTPREMKDTIMQLLGKWKDKQPDLAKAEKKNEQEK